MAGIPPPHKMIMDHSCMCFIIIWKNSYYNFQFYKSLQLKTDPNGSLQVEASASCRLEHLPAIIWAVLSPTKLDKNCSKGFGYSKRG